MEILILFLKLLAFIVFFVGGFLLIRRYISHSMMEVHNEVAGFIYAVVGVIYAVLLAFVVVTVWDEYTGAEDNVRSEVSHVIDIYRNANAFPDSVKVTIQTEAVQYMNDMVDHEWPAMEGMQISEEAKQSYLQLWKTHQDFRPADAFQTIWYEESVKELNQLADARRSRINSIHDDIHPFLWVVLFIGAFITICFSYLFGTKNNKAHVIMVISLSTSIGLILILIEAFVHPFSGLIHVSPEAFINGIQQLK